MPRKPKSVAGREDLPRLAELIRKALASTGRPQTAIGAAAGITRSHLANVLKAEKSLSPDKIRKFAEVTGASVSDLLDAAGYVESLTAIDAAIASRELTGRVTVVTDPKFLDSAIFLWIFKSKALRGLDIEWEIRSASWSSVPLLVDGPEKSIGFYNRKANKVIADKVLATPSWWADLAVYEGYGLLARPDDAPGMSGPPSLQEGFHYLELLLARKRAMGQRALVLSIDRPTFEMFKTALTRRIQWDEFDVHSDLDPDQALDAFLRGVGDLFVGGLPQRYRAEQRGCIPILSSANDPFLFSLNSLICSESMLREGTDVMSLITSTWYQVCRELRESFEFRSAMYEEISLMLTKELRVPDHSISRELIEAVFTEQGEASLEFFPRKPSGIVTRIFEKYKDFLLVSEENDLNAEETRKALKQVADRTLDPDAVDQQVAVNG